MKNKKVVYTIIGIISIALIALAITYAYWQITKSQTNSNVISSACLDISIDNEANDITLTEQYPISDEAGAELTPYSFTVTNNCDAAVDYELALEIIGESATTIATSAVKIKFGEETPILLSKKDVIDATMNNAFESRRLTIGTLAAKGSEGDSVSYKLRLWIDEKAPVSEVGKTFTSKISVTVGQGINNSIHEGTLAETLVNAYGGTSAISSDVASLSLYKEAEPTAEKSATITKTAKYWYATDYSFNETNGKYTLAGVKIQATIDQCRSGEVYCGRYSMRSTTETNSGTTLYIITSLTDSTKTDTTRSTYYKYQAQGVIAPNATGDGVYGMYKSDDDFGISYYYRGDTPNNYVQFGSYVAGTTVNGTTYESETPMYWRIVRINGDGTIRLIYDGVEILENSTASVVSVNNTDYADINSADYSDSLVKEYVEIWYGNNLAPGYSSYIADSIFCNDKEIYSESDPDTNYHYIQYTADLRVQNNPTFKCAQAVDRYTVANGNLAYPVGLITADELALAAGATSDMTYMYMYRADNFWTMTPANYSAYGEPAGVGTMIYSFYMDHIAQYNGIFGGFGVRPVINLKSDVAFTYNSESTAGTITDPYIIVTE